MKKKSAFRLSVVLTLVSLSFLALGCKTGQKGPDLNGNILTEYFMDMDTMKPSNYIQAIGPVKKGPDGKVNPRNLIKEGAWKQYFNVQIVYGKGSSKKVGPLQGQGNFADGKRDGQWTFYALEPLNKKNPTAGYKDPGFKQTDGVFQQEKRVGIWKTYHANGKVETEKNYVNGKIQGVGKSYYSNGKIFKEESYESSILHGVSTSYHSNGKMRDRVNYSNGEKNGQESAYHKNGKLRAQGEYRMGKKIGYWKFYHTNGSLAEEGNYILATVYNAEKKQQEERGVRNGPWKLYHENGRPKASGTYDKNKSVGLWTYFNKNGVRVANYTIKGIMVSGFSQLYDKSGSTVIGEGNMMGMPLTAKKNGPWKEISNGKMTAKGAYMMDKKNGRWEYYYPNGKIKTRGEYMMNKKNGMWTDYDENGNVVGKPVRWMMNKPTKF